MNNRELNEKLKAARIPEPSPEYWENFAKQVVSKAKTIRSLPERPSAFDAWKFAFRFALGTGLAAILVLAGYFTGYWKGQKTSEPTLLAIEKYYREIQTLFPNQIQAIVLDDSGAHLELAQCANVPASAPIFITISGPGGNRRIVTFSGQQIRVGGELCDVLVDHGGAVLLVGRKTFWSSSQPLARMGQFQIAAKALEGAS